MEEWRDIPGYEGLYRVSSVGRVLHLHGAPGKSRKAKGGRPERLLRPHTNKRGYNTVTVCRENNKKTIFVHVLMAAAFLGPRPDKMNVCHRNDVKTDNRLENIYYGTTKENAADCVRNGRISRGEARPQAVLTESDIIRMRSLSGVVTQIEMARMFQVARTTVQRILRGTSWAHIGGDIPAKLNPRRLNADAVREIRLLGESMPVANIAEKFGVTLTSIYSVLSGQSWKDVI